MGKSNSNSGQFRDITALIPIRKIERDHVVYENDTVAMVVKVIEPRRNADSFTKTISCFTWC